MPQFYKVSTLNDLPQGSVKHIDINDLSLAVYNANGKIYATSDICTHKQCHLSDGFLEGTVIECPCHGGKFDVITGEVKALPATIPIKTYHTRITNQDIEVEV